MRTPALRTAAGLLALLLPSLAAGQANELGWDASSDEPGGEERVWTPDELMQSFYDWLSPHGTWEEHPRYGWIWMHHDERFRPFSDGRWKGSAHGAQFESDTDYGWAVYHYGRWIYLRGRGWAWVPGFEWAESSVRFDEYQKYLASTGEDPPEISESVVVLERWSPGVSIGIGWHDGVWLPPPPPPRHHWHHRRHPRPPPAIAPPVVVHRRKPSHHRPPPSRGSVVVRPVPAPRVHQSAPVQTGRVHRSSSGNGGRVHGSSGNAGRVHRSAPGHSGRVHRSAPVSPSRR